MARIRTFKPEFFRSPDTAKASHTARLLFMAMWSWANDDGIGETNLYGLLGFAFPDEDELTVKDLQRLLKEIRGSFSVAFYGHRGRFYYAIRSWNSHQKTERRASGRFPGPDDADSVPDLRFEPVEEIGGFSEGTQGDSDPGTGEREPGKGNRGTTDLSDPDGPDDIDRTNIAVTEDDYPDTFKTIYPKAFEEWWENYPRKDAKKAALEAWKRACKRATKDAITAGAIRYAQDPNREDQYTKQPKTWLNGDCWLDDPLPSRSNAPSNVTAFQRKTAHNAAVLQALANESHTPELMP